VEVEVRQKETPGPLLGLLLASPDSVSIHLLVVEKSAAEVVVVSEMGHQ
jgi:hypothetical protein